LAYIRANAAIFSGETKHIILMIILENVPNLIFYTPAPDAKRCDQSDRADTRQEEQSNVLFTAITVGRLLGNTPYTKER